VVVVDDDPALLAIARRGLSDDYLVVEAPNGAAALWAASLNMPDVVIMDLELPDMPGYEVMQKLRDNVGCECPVIMLTGSAKGQDELDCLRAGVDDFLHKPYDMELLKERISLALKHRKGAYPPAEVVVDVIPDKVPAGSNFNDGEVFVWTLAEES
jgi:two-component system KDP operon response regulator KdpE